MSVRHGDITFGGSPHGGVRLDFRERVKVGAFRVPALYVTVEDLEGLAAALAERGIVGTDARTRIVPAVPALPPEPGDRPPSRSATCSTWFTGATVRYAPGPPM